MQSIILKPILKKRENKVSEPIADEVQPPRKLLDRVRDAIRVKHYSYQTEKTYVQPFCGALRCANSPYARIMSYLIHAP
jgi:hypothetical protein